MDRSRHLPLVAAAVRAPSSHNTQPWLFRLHDDAVDLLADHRRALPVNDPSHRELAISCGAALLNLRVAAARAGLAADVALRPDAGAPDLLARIRLGDGGGDDELAALSDAIDARHTTRAALQETPMADATAAALTAAAAAEGARLHAVEGQHRSRVAELVAEGNRRQFGDRRWRRELAHWLRPARRGDGLVTPAMMAPLSRFVVRHFDLGRRIAIEDETLALEAPYLAVLATDGDDTEPWLRAGQALQRVLLVAAGHGMQAGYLNQPCQVDELRPRLAAAIAPGEHPQLVVRIGVPAKPTDRSPRRPVEAVLCDAST